jgi:hypothetical protein
MGTFLQFLQLLIALGPQLVPVWQQILAFVQAHRGNQPLPAPTVASPLLSPAEDAHLLTLHDTAVIKGGMAAAAFNLGTLIQVWRYLQAHPELMQAIESIIQAFIKPQQVGARKLGKKAAKFDRRTLHLASYLQPLALPQIPNHCTWSSKVPSWPMYDNDRIGDCAIAGPAHLVQCWTGNDGQYVIPSDHEVIAGYEKVGHYNPNDPATDGGCVLLDVMNTWRKEGLFGTHKIGGFVSVTPADHDHMVCAGIHLIRWPDDRPESAGGSPEHGRVAGAEPLPSLRALRTRLVGRALRDRYRLRRARFDLRHVGRTQEAELEFPDGLLRRGVRRRVG